MSIVIVAVIALAGIFHAPINRQMHRWKLLPEPERLTELYFTNPNNLPKTYQPGEQQTVAFTVHNLEYRSTNYSYQITEYNQDGSQNQKLASGQFSLQNNQYRKTSVNIPTPDLGQKAKIEVKLIHESESIDYLVGRTGA